MKHLKYILAFLPARALFFAGDLVSDRLLDSDFESVEDIRWAIYQWAMRWSVKFDDWGDTELWRKL